MGGRRRERSGVRAGCQRIHLGRHTLERRASLTEGEWEPVPGQTGILCTEVGPVILSDTAALPQAFYRVVATPPP